MRTNQAAQSGATRCASVQSIAAHTLASASEDAVSPKRCYTAANLRDCVLAEVLAVIFAIGLVGFALVLVAIAALPVVWVIVAALRGVAMLWGRI